MAEKRSIFFHGLGITLRRLQALLWTYGFNLVLALAFTVPLYRSFSGLLDHSLAAQQISSGFDLGTVVGVGQRIRRDALSGATASHGSVLAFLLLYFLLVPGTLFSYLTRVPAKLSTLLQQGLLHFWRFVRITLLFILTKVILVGPLYLLYQRWADFVDDRFVGRTSLVLTLSGGLIVLLAATLVRLYFDLVEVYTVQLGTHNRFSGRPDHRVRMTLLPAFRLLRKNLFRMWMVFLVLSILGLTIVFFTTRTAIHMLAQRQVWPMFLMGQLGLFAMLFIRFWQRGAETSLALQSPISVEPETGRLREPYPYPSAPPKPTEPAPPKVDDRPHHVETLYSTDPLTPIYPAPITPETLPENLEQPLPAAQTTSVLSDPIPDPEPPVPALGHPDAGVFHHEPSPLHQPEGGPKPGQTE
jgi:hypothetical protein